jgi:hypothetical protein
MAALTFWRRISMRPAGNALVALLVMTMPLVWAAVMNALHPPTYIHSVQEDGALEWMSAWGFALAAICFSRLAMVQRNNGWSHRWLSSSLALFCIFVAVEEISWGQRVHGFLPPDYFLANNGQLEFNLHNLVASPIRKLLLNSVAIGYGVVLPLLFYQAHARRMLLRLGIWAPPALLIPGFAAASVTYTLYPWPFTGELVELMLAFGFLFIAITGWHQSRSRKAPWILISAPALLAAATLVMALGAASGWLSARGRPGQYARISIAAAESEALVRDFSEMIDQRASYKERSCNMHRRVYTWAQQSLSSEAATTEFAQFHRLEPTSQRSQYFIDPWNMPYWIRRTCSSHERRLTIYSFGPNRQRESITHRLIGDDIGSTRYLQQPQVPTNH